MSDERCPSCNSKYEHMYPATGCEGEAVFCGDPWHSRTKRGRKVQEAFRDYLPRSAVSP